MQRAVALHAELIKLTAEEEAKLVTEMVRDYQNWMAKGMTDGQAIRDRVLARVAGIATLRHLEDTVETAAKKDLVAATKEAVIG